MSKDVSIKDKEALSAYLDGELSNKQRINLEKRLKEVPDLSIELKELKFVREVVRNQPQIQAPKNFALTKEIVGIRPITRKETVAYPVLSSISVIASFLFIFVFLTDLVGFRSATTVDIESLELESAPVEAVIPEPLSEESETSLAQAERSSATVEGIAVEDSAAADLYLQAESVEIPPEASAKAVAETAILQESQEYYGEQFSAPVDLQAESGEVPPEASAKAVAETAILQESQENYGEPFSAPVVLQSATNEQLKYLGLEVLLLLLAFSSGIGAYLLRKGYYRRYSK